jgi:TonB family protein
MGPRVWKVGFALAVVFGVLALLPAKGIAQEASADAAKRKLRNNVLPVYPPLAKKMELTGKVKIETKIAADGHVLNTRVIGGNPLLVNAALDAIKQWRFEPGPKDTTEIFQFDFDKPE